MLELRSFEIDIFFIKTDPNKDKFYKIYHFNFISQKLSAATQGASNFKIEILYVKLKAYKTPIFRAIQTRIFIFYCYNSLINLNLKIKKYS